MVFLLQQPKLIKLVEDEIHRIKPKEENESRMLEAGYNVPHRYFVLEF
jgi:hypothetical protein